MDCRSRMTRRLGSNGKEVSERFACALYVARIELIAHGHALITAPLRTPHYSGALERPLLKDSACPALFQAAGRQLRTESLALNSGLRRL